LILADPEDFCELRADTVEPPYLHGRQGQTIGGIVLRAVSDHPYFEAPTQPANLGPVGVSPRLTHRVAIAPAVLLQATHNRPSIVPNAFEERLRRVPGVKEHLLRATAPAMAGITEPFQSQRVLRGAAFMPEAHAQGEPHGPMGPDQEDEGEPIDRLMVLAGIHPCQARDSCGTWFGNHGVIADELPPLPDEQCATGQFQASWPGPVRWQQSRQAVVGHRFKRLRQGDATRGWAIIPQGGAIVPHQRWPRVPSFVVVGWALYSISSLLRNP
jgi:hypothetical protein